MKLIKGEMRKLRTIFTVGFFIVVLLATIIAEAQPVITQQPTNQAVLVGSNVTFSATVTSTEPFTYQWQINGTNLFQPNDFIITTVAGNGTNGYSGDGGAATNAVVLSPSGVTVDAGGNLFIADSGNNCIRKVGTNGIITTVAGNGISGYSGDGGFAINATLSSPSGVTVDASGNLFIADLGNNRVRKVGTNGIITTVAGNGTSFGNPGSNEAATNVSLSSPVGVAVDVTGNLFIVDTGHQRICKVGTNGIITTVAGNGLSGFSGDGGAATSAELSYPHGVTVDASGNLFIADSGNRVRKVNTNGIITTVAGNGTNGYSGDGGAATSAELNLSSVVVDASGNLFIADSGNNCIRKVGTNGIITTVAGNGLSGYSGDGGYATNTPLYNPSGVSVDASGNLFIADSYNNRVRKVNTNCIITTVAGKGTYSGDGGAATNAELSFAAGVFVDASGNLFIADESNERIRKVGANGIITTVAGNGISGYSGDGGYATNTSLYNPSGVSVDASGNLFIADSYNNRVRKVGTNGIITTVAGNGTNGYSGDGGAATSGKLNYPNGVILDASGNLFIADLGNNRIRKVNTVSQPSFNQPILSIPTVSASNAGNYSVIVTGSGGSVTSSVVSLMVITPLAITSQPLSLTNNASSTATFTVGVSGTSPVYQWFKNSSPISGAVFSTLTLPSVQDADAASYWVVVTNLAGSVTSAPPATLSVNDTLFIAVQPSSQTIGLGSNVTFSATAYGAAPLVFQWYFNGNPIGSATTGTNVSTYTLTNVQTNKSGNYSVQVFNGNGSVTSSNAVLSVITFPPSIANQPVGQSILQGRAASFTVFASGSAPLKYQWQFNGTNILRATNATYAITAVVATNTGNYSVTVTNSAGSVTSSNALLWVIVPPSVSLRFLAGYPQLNLNGMANSNFTVQYSTNLARTNWINLRSISNLQTIPYQFLDPSGMVPPARFYRALMQ